MTSEKPSVTAEVMALVRAAELDRPREARILEDPWAEIFVGRTLARGYAAWKKVPRLARFSGGLGAYVLCRHRFIEEELLRSIGAIEQVVLLGAGYDMRVYRFAEALRGRTVFELDFPATQRRKLELLEPKRSALPHADVRYVEIDFETQSMTERLADAGYRKQRPTFFIWEGVPMYLPRDTVERTLRELRQLGGTSSRLAADFRDGTLPPGALGTVYRWTWKSMALLREPVRSVLPDGEREEFLADVGFEATEVVDTQELRRRYVTDGRRIGFGMIVLSAVTR